MFSDTNLRNSLFGIYHQYIPGKGKFIEVGNENFREKIPTADGILYNLIERIRKLEQKGCGCEVKKSRK